MTRALWVVEHKEGPSWEVRSCIFFHRGSALAHIRGLVENAGYNRKRLRTVKFRRVQ